MFEIRSELRKTVVQALARESTSQPSVGLLFLTGALAGQADLIAEELLPLAQLTEWLVVSAVGVLSSEGEVEGESAAVGYRLPVRGVVLLDEGDGHPFGPQLRSKVEAAGGLTACVFVRGDTPPHDWLTDLREMTQKNPGIKLFGGGGLPGEPVRALIGGRVRSGKIGAVVFPGRARSQILSSSACRLLSPLGQVTKAQGAILEEIDGMSALESLRLSTGSLDEGALVLLATADGERPLGPAGRTLALQSIVGVDPRQGTLLLSDQIHHGTRVAFAVKDAHQARIDLTAHVRALRAAAAGTAPEFGIYISCAGRGQSLYRAKSVDTRIIANQFPGMPFVGLHATFELAPLGNRLMPQVGAGVLGVFSRPS